VGKTPLVDSKRFDQIRQLGPGKGIRLSGWQGSSKSLLISQLAQSLNRTLVLFVNDHHVAESLLQDIEFFLRDKIPVSIFPTLDALPYFNLSPHPDEIMERLGLLWQLTQTKQSRVLIVPLAADKFIQVEVGDPSILSLLRKLKPGDLLAKDLLQKLGAELQYLRLVHQPKMMSKEALDSAQKALLKQLKGTSGFGVAERMEASLIDERRRREASQTMEDVALSIKDPNEKETKQLLKDWWGSRQVFVIYVLGAILAGFVCFGIFRIFF